MLLSKGVSFTNNRYIKSSPEIFQTNLAELLLKKFGSETYKLDKSITLDTHEKIRFALSNISIKNGEFEYPNTLLNSDIQSDIYLLLKESHEKTKVDVANLQKSSKKTSPEHITTLEQQKKRKKIHFRSN